MNGHKSYTPVEMAQLRSSYFATRPTGFTRFLRTSLLWQFFRFVVINLKMVRIIRLSHRKHS